MELQQAIAERALVGGKIDAFFHTVENPNTSITATSETPPIRIIALNSLGIPECAKTSPCYVMATITAGTYPGMEQIVDTYATKARVVTRATTDVDLALVKSINDSGRVVGKETIAESAQGPTIVEKLREIGVHYAQGYANGCPQPIDQLILHTDSPGPGPGVQLSLTGRFISLPFKRSEYIFLAPI